MLRTAFIAALVLTVAAGALVFLRLRWSPDHGESLSGLAARLDRLEKRLDARCDELARRLEAAPRGDAGAAAPASIAGPGADLDAAREDEIEATPEERLGALESRLAMLLERVDGLAQDPLNRGFAYAASESAELRRRGIRALAQVARSDPEALRTVRGLLDDLDPGVRRAAVEAIEDAGDQDSVPRLLALVGDADAQVREQAIQSAADLLERADPTDPRLAEASQAVAERLGDGDVEVRRAAAEVLGEFRHREVVPALVAALEDPDREVREEVVRSLSDLADPRAAPALRALYGQGESPLALDLAAALQRMGDAEPLRLELAKLSRQAVEGSDERARRAAVRALARHGGTAAREVLQQAANDSSPRVREEAERALRERPSR